MHKDHKRISWAILIAIFLIACSAKVQMTDTTAQSLVTFFSILFGFYMTSLTIFYKSSYIKELYKTIDQERKRRRTYILKRYLQRISECLISSISCVFFFMMFATRNANGILSVDLHPFVLPLIEITIDFDFNLLVVSLIFAMAALNIFYMLLIINEVIKAVDTEAKN